MYTDGVKTAASWVARARRHAQTRSDAGVSLVEMLVAIMVVMIAAVAVLGVITNGLHAQTMITRADRTTGITQQIMAKAREVPFADLGFYGSDSAAPSGTVALPVATLSGDDTQNPAHEDAVLLGDVRPAGDTAFTQPVQTFSDAGVDYRITTYVTWVPAAEASTVPSAKRVTVVSQWAPQGVDLDGDCTQEGTRCTVQSSVRVATAADIDPLTGDTPTTSCISGAEAICEAYIRSGRVLDGGTMATATDLPQQVAPVDLYLRTATPATAATATWQWFNADGTVAATVVKPLVSDTAKTVWTAEVPVDTTSTTGTAARGDIRPGSTTVTFQATINGHTITQTRDAFWSYELADGPNALGASITEAPGWCSPAGSAFPVKFLTTGLSAGFADGTASQSAQDTVQAVFTVTTGAKTSTVTVPATLLSTTQAGDVSHGTTTSSWVDALWQVNPPATDTCDTRAVSVLVHRATDQTITPITLQLPVTTPVIPTVDAPTVTLTLDQATGAWTATWNTPNSATSFTVETTVSGGAAQATTQATTAKTGTLARGQALDVRVQAASPWAVSPWSTTASVTRIPDAPIVTAVRAANTVTFTWPAVAGATSYERTLAVFGSATTTTTGTARTLTVTVPRGGTATLDVKAVNAAGASAPGSASGVVPLWDAFQLAAGWDNYGGSWAPARYTRTNSGIVYLQGLINHGTAGYGVDLGTLPEGYRPTGRLIFTQQIHGTLVDRVDVLPDGRVILYSNHASDATLWTSLTGIAFAAADADVTWYTPTLTNGWTNYGGSFASLQAALTTDGGVYLQGLVVAGTTGNDTLIASTPSALAGPYLHFKTLSNNVFSTFGNDNSPTGVVAKPNTPTGWTSVMGHYSTATTGWWTSPLENGWVAYDTSRFPAPQYIKDADGVVTLRGLLRAGTTTYGTTIMTLRPGYRPDHQLIFSVDSSETAGRIDVNPDGTVVVREGIAANWTSLDSITFMADQ